MDGDALANPDDMIWWYDMYSVVVCQLLFKVLMNEWMAASASEDSV